MDGGSLLWVHFAMFSRGIRCSMYAGVCHEIALEDDGLLIGMLSLVRDSGEHFFTVTISDKCFGDNYIVSLQIS